MSINIFRLCSLNSLPTYRYDNLLDKTGLLVLLSMSFIMLCYVRQKSKSLFDKNKAQSNLNNNRCALNVREP